MSVSIGPERITLLGSLPKFFMDSDEQPYLLTGQTKQAIEKLSDLSGVDLRTTNVWRVDVAANLLTTQSPKLYLPVLSGISRYDRSIINDSTLYLQPKGKRRSRNLQFYPKEQYYLRYELQILRPSVLFSHPPVWGRDLYSPPFRYRAAKSWKAHFDRIELINPTTPRTMIPPPNSTMTEAINCAIATVLADPNHREIFLDSIQDKKIRYKLKLRAKETKGPIPLCETMYLEDCPDMAEELRQRVRGAYGVMEEEVNNSTL